jgi:phosphatidylserine/phosphatidylglycerophosphate/cardiolipin synthase-like enzyme
MGVIHGLAAADAALPAELRARSIYYATIGSMNMDPISARANGEVLTLISGPAAMIGFVDFFQLAGAVTWVESTAELDALLPRAGKWKRYFAHRFRNVL